MSSQPKWSHYEDATPEGATVQSSSWDDAEKGIYDSTLSLPVVSSPPAAYLDEKRDLYLETWFPPNSPVHEGLTPFSSVPQLSLSWPKGWKSPTPEVAAPRPVVKTPKPKPSRWILFQLWFNTYRKFFVFVTSLNLTGIVLNACGRFSYAENHLGALVLGNLLCAILMRNELFLRFLYLISIYGLRSVRLPSSPLIHPQAANRGMISSVGSGAHQIGSDFDSAACRRHSLGMCALWRLVR